MFINIPLKRRIKNMIDKTRPVLVTGADGFIGSHLVDLLLSEGFTVRALSQYNSFNSRGWLEGNNHPRLEVVSGDVRDANFCREITRGCSTVFHLAALIAIPYSYIAPDSYVDTNIKGTLNMCQAAKDAGIERIVVTSTSEVYGTAKYVPIDEKHPRQPQSPYSATKIGADAIALSFYNAFELPVVIARPFNTYGPRQSARAIIPTIISQIAAGATEIKVGDLTPTRDFNFVEDTCRGFLALAQTEGIEGRDINIATGTEITMADTLDLIAKLMGKDVRYVVDSERIRPSKSEVRRLCGDNTVIISLTSWRPQVSIEEGLRRTIEWFTDAKNLAKYKPFEYNR
jgi:NAD dependent epimerase/dehydratase